MSEYTTFYLRYRAVPLLEYKDWPSYDELINLSESDRKQLFHELNDHNNRVSESLGSELLCLPTTPSRELSIIPWAESPQVVAISLLEKIMSFYAEEIDECHRYIAEGKEFEGIIRGISDIGRLIVETGKGELKEFAFKEIEYII